MCESFVCMYVNHVSVELRRVHQISLKLTGTTDSCEPPWACWEVNLTTAVCSQLLNHLFEISTVAVLFSELSGLQYICWCICMEDRIWRWCLTQILFTFLMQGLSLKLEFTNLLDGLASKSPGSSCICVLKVLYSVQHFTANTLLTEPSLSASGLLFCKRHYKHLL